MDFHGTIVDGKNEKNPPPVSIGKFVPLFPSIYAYIRIFISIYGVLYLPGWISPFSCPFGGNPARPVPFCTIALAESPRYHGVPLWIPPSMLGQKDPKPSYQISPL